MNRTSISRGLYRDASGFWIRPVVDGRRTWRRLASVTADDARIEAASIMADHARAGMGLCRSPFKPKPPTTFREAWEASGRTGSTTMLEWWGPRRLSEITRETADEWARLRADFPRAADIELATVAAVIKSATGETPLKGRKRVQPASDVRHSREVMPANGDELHELARRLLRCRPSQGVGWQLLLQGMTGLRTQEILALRMDAGRREPGWVEGNYLYVRRAKGGLFPYVEVHPALRDAIAAHHRWHAEAAPNSPYWFPGSDWVRPLNRVALTHALERLGPPKRTAHGLRAFFVTVCRSRGESDRQVAARIGDQTEALIATTYGALPEVWAGGEPLSWMPRDGTPAWEAWSAPENVVAVNFSAPAASAEAY